jgi:hypothetical protein
LASVTVRELITKIGFDLDERQMKKAEDAVNKLKKRIKTGMKVAAAGVTAAIAGIAVASVKAAGDMELITTQFEVMLGSAEKAIGLMKELETFSFSIGRSGQRHGEFTGGRCCIGRCCSYNENAWRYCRR